VTHIAEDKLLEYALEIIDSKEERVEIEDHLIACPECAARLDKIHEDIKVIGNVRPFRQTLPMPNPRQSRLNMYAVLKMAALFLFGIFVGFGASQLADTEPAPVAPAYTALSSPIDSLRSFAVSDATDIPAHYYDMMMKNTN
jgi:hypothetical protein